MRKSKRTLRIAIFVVDYYIWCSPSLVNLLKHINNQFSLTVFLRNPHRKDIIFLNNNNINQVRLYSLGMVENFRDIFRGLRKFWFDFMFFLKKLYLKQDIVVSVDTSGELFFLRLFPRLKTSRIHYSLELWLPGDSLGDFAEEAPLPMDVYRDIDFASLAGLMIQSEERSSIFRKAFSLPDDFPTLLLPVTAEGPASGCRSQYVRSKYNLLEESFVLLYLGGLGNCVSLEKLIEAFPKDPKYILFMHGFEMNSTPFKSLYELNQRRGCENIIFSTEVFNEPADADKIVQSCDAGFVWYEPWCENMRTAGGSSGKIVSYLKSGLPIISNSQCGTKPYVADTGCGILIETQNQITAAMDAIKTHWKQYSMSALEEYEKRYRFDNYVDSITSFIEEMNSDPLGHYNSSEK